MNDRQVSPALVVCQPGGRRWLQCVAAAGGEPDELACEDDLAGELGWRDDGRLQSTAYPGAESDDDPLSWFIDPATGAVEAVPTGEIPRYREPPDNAWPGPNGEDVTCHNGGGKLTLTLAIDGRSRTLLSTGAPSPLHGPGDVE